MTEQSAPTAPEPRPTGPLGVVGLGNMGLAIAERLGGAGEVCGSDLSPRRREQASAAGVQVVEPEELRRRCPVVLLSLPQPAASRAVVGQIAADRGAVRCVVETSTVTPSDVLACKAVLDEADVALVDAAILSGVAQMRSGTAGLVLSGDRARIDDLAAVFDRLTANQVVLGAAGTAMAAKVVNNAVAHVVMVLLSEAMTMAVSAGLDPDAVIDILKAPEGGLMRPLTHRIAERALSGDYEGGMSLASARKDSVLAQQMAQDAGVPLLTVAAAHSAYEMAMGQGWGDEDYASLAKLWEGWTGRSLVRPPAGDNPTE